MIVLKTENMMRSTETQDFNVKNSPIKKGKNHGRQPAKLYYMGVFTNTVAYLMMQLTLEYI
jgi:hypothetical protein